MNGGGAKEHHTVQSGVEGAEEEALYSPGRALVLNEAHNVGHVEEAKADGETEQGGHNQVHISLLLVVLNGEARMKIMFT